MPRAGASMPRRSRQCSPTGWAPVRSGLRSRRPAGSPGHDAARPGTGAFKATGRTWPGGQRWTLQAWPTASMPDPPRCPPLVPHAKQELITVRGRKTVAGQYPAQDWQPRSVRGPSLAVPGIPGIPCGYRAGAAHPAGEAGALVSAHPPGPGRCGRAGARPATPRVLPAPLEGRDDRGRTRARLLRSAIVPAARRGPSRPGSGPGASRPGYRASSSRLRRQGREPRTRIRRGRPGLPKMSTSSARISMHEMEYSLAFSGFTVKIRSSARCVWSLAPSAHVAARRISDSSPTPADGQIGFPPAAKCGPRGTVRTRCGRQRHCHRQGQ